MSDLRKAGVRVPEIVREWALDALDGRSDEVAIRVAARWILSLCEDYQRQIGQMGEQYLEAIAERDEARDLYTQAEERCSVAQSRAEEAEKQREAAEAAEKDAWRERDAAIARVKELEECLRGWFTHIGGASEEQVLLDQTEALLAKAEGGSDG